MMHQKEKNGQNSTQLTKSLLQMIEKELEIKYQVPE